MKTLLLLAVLGQQDLDTALDDMAKIAPGDATAYAAARDKVLAMGAGIVDALAVRGATDKWTPAGWVRALCAESCRIRLTKPEMAAAVDKPRGVDPAYYLKLRKPAPMCQRDLRHLGAECVPLLLERSRWTLESASWSKGVAGDAEKAALRDALLAVPGELADIRACHALTQALSTGDDASRAIAAVSLGQCGGANALPALTGTLDDKTQSITVREACARALGRIPNQGALDAIRQRIATSDDLRSGLVTALGLLGCDAVWVSRGAAYASIAPGIRQGCAETLVDELKRPNADVEGIGFALALVAWPPSLAAAEAVTKDAKVIEPLKAALSRK